MPVLIIAGLSSTLVDRVKAAQRKSQTRLPADWSLCFVNTQKRTPSLSLSDVERVFKEASKSVASHVVGVSTIPGESRSCVAKRIRPFFRFRWFENKHLPLIYNSNPEIVRVLAEIADEEKYWGQHIKPKSHIHALILPRCSFNSKGKYGNLWDSCEMYGSIDNLTAAIRQLELFDREYGSSVSQGGRGWKDSKRIFFNPYGQRHAKAPEWYHWKYSFPLPEGFHYDVSHDQNQFFHVKDANGALHKVAQGEHLNLDPHGRVRC